MTTFFPPGLLVIMPNRLAAAREKERLLEESGAGVVISPKVYTFGRLEMELLKSLAPARPRMTDLGRTMLLEKILIAESRQSGWPNGPIGPGFKRAAISVVDQIRASGLSPDEFKQAAQAVAPAGRVSFFFRVLESYERVLEEKGLVDRAGARLDLVRELNRGAPFAILEGIHEIRALGFNRLTPFQADLLKALAGRMDLVELQLDCPNWVLELPYDSSLADNPWRETLDLVRTFEAMGGRNRSLEIIYQDPATRLPETSGLRRIAACLFKPDQAEADSPLEHDSNQVRILAAPGLYAEVEEIGRRVAKLLDQGVKPERIAVGVSEMGRYAPLVEDVFRRFDAPIFFRRGSPLVIQAPVRAVLSLIRLAGSNWERELVMDLMASPYLDLGFETTWRKAAEISAKAGVTDERAGGGWRAGLTRLAAAWPDDVPEIESFLTGLEKLKERLEPLKRSLTWREFNQIILNLLEEFRLEANLQRGDRSFLHRDASAWALLRGLLADLARAAAESGRDQEKFTPDQIAKALQEAAQPINVGGRGMERDVVMVLDLHDLHGLGFDHLFLAGLNEGAFPKPRIETFPFSDGERKRINRAAKKKALSVSDSDYRQEELLFYHAAAAARKSLVLSYSRQDERGRIRLPSSLLDEVLRLWPKQAERTEYLPARVMPPLSEALTRQEIIGNLARTIPLDFRTDQAPLPAELSQRPQEAARWESLRRRFLVNSNLTAGRGGRVSPDALRPMMAKLPGHQGAPLLSPTFLERFGQCPFLFFGEKVLNLQAPSEPDDGLPAMNEGSILHDILKTFFQRCRIEDLLPLAGRDREREVLIEEAEKEWAEAEKKMPIGRMPLWAARKRDMTRVLLSWLSREQSWAEDFRPEFFEWSFGPGGEHEPLAVDLREGLRLYFRGRVDRIDLGPDRARVIDYKNSANSNKYKRLLGEAELGRSSFQAPLYQLATAEAVQKPVSASFIALRDFEQDKLHSSPRTDSEVFSRNIETRESLALAQRPNFFNGLADAWDQIDGGDFAPRPSDPNFCDYCEFQAACRLRQQGD